MMHRFLEFIRSSVAEIILVLGLAFCVSFFDAPKVRIDSDGHGYYEYLPSIFLRNDFNRGDAFTQLKDTTDLTYVLIDGHYVQKYPCGVAILQAPFFIGAMPFIKAGEDGYSYLLQSAIYIAALFYLLAGLIAIRLLLQSYSIGKRTIVLVQFALAFGTSLMFYTAYQSSFSHIYSFAAIALMMLLVRKFCQSPSWKIFNWLCIVFGLVLLIRPVNIVAIGMFPFLAGSRGQLGIALRFLLAGKWRAMSGILIVAAIFNIQCLLWYLQCGKWLVDTYPGEKFDFLDPHVIDFLFGFKKGVFVYAPVLLLSFAGIIVLIARKRYYEAATVTGFVFVMSYLFSSWHVPEYGCSFGSRVFTDYYALCAVLMAIGVSSFNRWGKVLSGIYVFLCVLLSFIQVWQYNHYILHWYAMNYDRYCRVFLKTEKKYEGLLFKPEVWESWPVREEILTGEFSFPEWKTDTLFIRHYDPGLLAKPALLTIEFSTDWEACEDAEVEITVRDSASEYLHFCVIEHVFEYADENDPSKGKYPYFLPVLNCTGELTVMARVVTKGAPVELKNCKVVLYQQEK